MTDATWEKIKQDQAAAGLRHGKKVWDTSIDWKDPDLGSKSFNIEIWELWGNQQIGYETVYFEDGKWAHVQWDPKLKDARVHAAWLVKTRKSPEAYKEVKDRKIGVREAIYPKMVGVAELIKFYKAADKAQIEEFEELLNTHHERKAYEILGGVLHLSKGETRKMTKYLQSSLERAKSILKKLNEKKQTKYWFPISFRAYVKLGTWADSLEEAKKEVKEFFKEEAEVFKRSHYLKDASIEEVEEIGEPTIEESLREQQKEDLPNCPKCSATINYPELGKDESVCPACGAKLKWSVKISEQVGFSTQGRGSKEDWVGAGIKSGPQIVCKDCGAKFFATGYSTPLNVPAGPKAKIDIVCPSCGSKNVSTVKQAEKEEK